MRHIVYYTSGTTGSGRVVTGIAIGNALKRAGITCTFTIVHGSSFDLPVPGCSFVRIPLEGPDDLSPGRYHSSHLFSTLTRLNPDILLVDLLWFPLHWMLGDLHCKKIFLCRQVTDNFFTMTLPSGIISFDPGRFDAVIATEPFASKIAMDRINPVIIRNHSEILSRTEALMRLDLDEGGPIGLFAYNGEPGENERIREKYRYLETEDVRMVFSTNRGGAGLFPAVDYFNAFDFLLSGAGYNAYWEARFFGKKAYFEPVPRRFEDQARRVIECASFSFEVNGGDQLAAMIGHQ